MFKVKKLTEVFIKKFRETSLELQGGLDRQREGFISRNSQTQSKPQIGSIGEYIGYSIQYIDKLKDESSKTLDKYLKLIKPREINIEKFYKRIQPTIDGFIDGHIRSLEQKKSELLAMYSLQNSPAGAHIGLEIQIKGINNFKNYFKKKITEEILFDYNISPRDIWSRTKEQIFLIVIGVVIGNLTDIMGYFQRTIDKIIMLIYS